MVQVECYNTIFCCHSGVVVNIGIKMHLASMVNTHSELVKLKSKQKDPSQIWQKRSELKLTVHNLEQTPKLHANASR